MLKAIWAYAVYGKRISCVIFCTSFANAVCCSLQEEKECWALTEFIDEDVGS